MMKQQSTSFLQVNKKILRHFFHFSSKTNLMKFFVEDHSKWFNNTRNSGLQQLNVHFKFFWRKVTQLMNNLGDAMSERPPPGGMILPLSMRALPPMSERQDPILDSNSSERSEQQEEQQHDQESLIENA